MMVGFAIIAIGALLPWALLGRFVVSLYRFIRNARTAKQSFDAAVA